ncbi:MAG: hypothetical protein RJA10_22 [Pseudomonadota bacterium]|jgi:hypothetical protein
MSSTTRTKFSQMTLVGRPALASALRVEGDAIPVVVFVPASNWDGVFMRVAGTLLGQIVLLVSLGDVFGSPKAGRVDPLGVFLVSTLAACLLADTASWPRRRHLGKGGRFAVASTPCACTWWTRECPGSFSIRCKG